MFMSSASIRTLTFAASDWLCEKMYTTSALAQRLRSKPVTHRLSKMNRHDAVLRSYQFFVYIHQFLIV